MLHLASRPSSFVTLASPSSGTFWPPTMANGFTSTCLPGLRPPSPSRTANWEAWSIPPSRVPWYASGMWGQVTSSFFLLMDR